MLIIRRFQDLTLRTLAVRSNLIVRDFSDRKKDDSDSSDSDREDKKKPRKQPIKEETAAERLNKLLSTMNSEDNTQIVKNINMAKPGGSKKRSKAEDESKDVVEAAKNVASLLGEENQKQTEAELLNKLLNPNGTPPTTQSTKEATDPNELSLSDLIVGMKIDRRQPAIEYSRSEFVRKSLAPARPDQSRDRSVNRGRGGKNQHQQQQQQQHQRQPEPNTGSVNLFGAKPLDIFKDPSKLRDSPDMIQTWDHLHQHELKLAITHPPANYFQKMALWTEQGKLWKFPIDNEQGMDEEHATDFSEHIFLEQHLEPWCPTKGPIRHFMELVCVGLSKNPYITAREKKAHILWYRDYFEDKKELLKEIIIPQKETPKTVPSS
ncbi:28S ribosomal protein S31, mitochondrial [Episyrphus balteatus]|uniref:28S ribosomal protein S31, mitochondrial n=1 Tax=Episyrphus balteatus TaxID=286459 RepID=UPI002485920C|nr:28S ribosomal protein S31, mitochondrial [Episyrphus balteatus]